MFQTHTRHLHPWNLVLEGTVGAPDAPFTLGKGTSQTVRPPPGSLCRLFTEVETERAVRYREFSWRGVGPARWYINCVHLHEESLRNKNRWILKMTAKDKAACLWGRPGRSRILVVFQALSTFILRSCLEICLSSGPDRCERPSTLFAIPHVCPYILRYLCRARLKTAWERRTDLSHAILFLLQ